MGERIRTSFKIDHGRSTLDESFEIHLRNHKAEAVEILVVEHLYRWSGWEIVENSNTFLKTDSRTVEFRLEVPPNEEKRLGYTVHYAW